MPGQLLPTCELNECLSYCLIAFIKFNARLIPEPYNIILRIKMV